MSDVVAGVFIAPQGEAGFIPRQASLNALSSANQLRVISRIMQGVELTNRIEERLKFLRYSAQAASLRVSDNRDLIRNVVRFGEKANPKQETLGLIAQALDWTLDELLNRNVPVDAPAKQTSAAPEFIHADIKVPTAREMPRDIPVLGTALGSLVDDKFEGFQLEGGPIDYVRRPPGLTHAADAYAIYVQNDSMWPMHSAGDLRFANPHKPPKPGGTVIVQTRHWDSDPGQGYIKIFRRRTSTMLILEQLNPPATIEIPLRFVVSVHHVPDMAELFGV